MILLLAKKKMRTDTRRPPKQKPLTAKQLGRDLIYRKPENLAEQNLRAVVKGQGQSYH